MPKKPPVRLRRSHAPRQRLLPPSKGTRRRPPPSRSFRTSLKEHIPQESELVGSSKERPEPRELPADHLRRPAKNETSPAGLPASPEDPTAQETFVPQETQSWDPPPLAVLAPPTSAAAEQRERVQLAMLAQRLVHRLQVGSQNGERQLRLRLRGRSNEGLEVRLQESDEGLVATVVDLFGRQDPTAAQSLADAIAREGQCQGLSLDVQTA